MIDGNTLLFGIVGDPVGHSLSPLMHNANIESLGLNYAYVPFHVKKENIQNLISGAKALNIQGLNVTIPHKIEVIKYLDEIDSLAENIGAVNTIKFTDGIAKGYNTDAIGAMTALKEKTDIKNKNVLVLGAGGASRAISYALCEEDVNSITILNRHINKAEALADDISSKTDYTVSYDLQSNSNKYLKDTDIIINTTPNGMYPHVDDKPLIYAQEMNSDMAVFDIVYTPLETGILKEAKKIGATRISGIKMFLYQGVESFKIWTGIDANSKVMEDVILKASGIDDIGEF
ncbi:shikimate dehydrogenase [Methanobrevibacter sp. 87.7]|uniref:shikimate dehydrogenase n=1 Tax=Methanobrevibacter sp. 87.7 TaxID=387957 RepID=UPI000B503C5D|nr:shikimate dehydrogenase [Methanobrevibacter sp. 87.7]OWT33800.1 shikimate dehydrogenase [Methanobrevibacter sp. 87.7]